MTDVAFHPGERALPTLKNPLMLIGVMGIATGADLLADSFAHFSSPGLLLLPAIALVGIGGGMRYAIAAASLSILFVAVIYSSHAAIFHPPFDGLIRFGIFCVSAPIIAIVVGLQHHQLEETTAGRINQALRVRAEDLAELARALKLSNDELDQFTYVTSHDLKAPLRGIHNLSVWLEEDLGDKVTPQAREQLKLLRGRVQRMESLINGLLEYAHVGRSAGKIERVDVAALLAEIVDWIGPPADVQIHVSPAMPVLRTDRLRLQQVLTNLIENAVKHRGRSNGYISIACETTGQFYRFSITDDGPGIEPQYQQRIFGIFQTLLPRDTLEGTGIGLALVKKVVEGKGGGVTLESTPGRGSTFRFTWPRSEEENSK